MTRSHDVVLRRARHPLLDRAAAVPIDLELGALRALVISGPNTGGKTVALKTLGLAAALHQCGLRPPADEVSLPVFDEILADIGDEQSIAMSLSTFSAHVRNLLGILETATERSLVLLDELAAGTDPVEGAALAQALLGRLAGQARLTVTTSHYAELKEWASAAERRGQRRDRQSIPRATSPSTRSSRPPRHVTRAPTAERLGLPAPIVAAARDRDRPGAAPRRRARGRSRVGCPRRPGGARGCGRPSRQEAEARLGAERAEALLRTRSSMSGRPPRPSGSGLWNRQRRNWPAFGPSSRSCGPRSGAPAGSSASEGGRRHPPRRRRSRSGTAGSAQPPTRALAPCGRSHGSTSRFR